MRGSKLLSSGKEELAQHAGSEIEWIAWVFIPLSFAPLFVNLTKHQEGKVLEPNEIMTPNHLTPSYMP